MQLESFVYSAHATLRMQQRNLRKSEVDYVCKHGSRTITAGAVFYFLGKRDILPQDRRNDKITRLMGTTVLLDSRDGKTVLTAYRNPGAPKRNRRKTKYRKPNRPSSTSALPLAA